jgi:hypothetical protein
MHEHRLDAVTRERLLNSWSQALAAFHKYNDLDPTSIESRHFRSELAGIRFAVQAICGQRAASDMLNELRARTNSGIPHVGPMTADGTIHGFDSDADDGL